MCGHADLSMAASDAVVKAILCQKLCDVLGWLLIDGVMNSHRTWHVLHGRWWASGQGDFLHCILACTLWGLSRFWQLRFGQQGNATNCGSVATLGRQRSLLQHTTCMAVLL
jgi:hypothetical protein